MAGEIDTIEILEGRNLDEVTEEIKARAIQKAVRSGARVGESLETLMAIL